LKVIAIRYPIANKSKFHIMDYPGNNLQLQDLAMRYTGILELRFGKSYHSLPREWSDNR